MATDFHSVASEREVFQSISSERELTALAASPHATTLESLREHTPDFTQDSVSLEVARRGYYDKLMQTLAFFGWLPKPIAGLRRHIPFIITISLDIFVVVTTAQAGFSDFKLLYYVSSVLRHVLILVAHLGMYCVGGNQLSVVLGRPDFLLRRPHFMVLAILTAMEYALDLYLLYVRLSCGGCLDDLAHAANVLAIRSSVMLERLPSVLSLMVVASLAEKLCQNLVFTRQAFEAGDVRLAQRLYCDFWKELRMGRRWYNAVATAHFLIAVGRIPVAFYIFSHWRVVELSSSEVSNLLAYSAIDMVQMMVWIKPAILTRRQHGRVMRASVEAASQQAGRATALATMIATLHPLVGLKMFGFLVTWRLVTQVATLASLAYTGLRYLLE